MKATVDDECGAMLTTLHGGRSTHVCVRPHGHSGPHQCGGVCRHRWDANCACGHATDAHDDTIGTACLVNGCVCIGFRSDT